jgi:type VI secretion system secreted protein VgrG
MPTPRTQKHSQVGIETPLGPDALLLRSAEVTEELGRLFEIRASLLSEDFDIDPESLMGQPAAVRLTLGDGTSRYFHGHVCRFEHTGQDDRLCYYEATIVPWTWFLTRNANCRIFQHIGVPDIFQTVCADQGYTALRMLVDRPDYPTREFCVQYRESDYNFLWRLLEDEGIYSWFEHEAQRHVLVLADGPEDHEPVPGMEHIRHHPAKSDEPIPSDRIWGWRTTRQVRTGAVALDDFNYLIPRTSLASRAEQVREHPGASQEAFDYPGRYDSIAAGERYSRLRLEEVQADHKVFQAVTNARALRIGAKFELTDHPRSAYNAPYIVTRALTRFRTAGFDAGGEPINPDGLDFSCELTLAPGKAQFRPARITPRPVVRGPQTAMVVGNQDQSDPEPDELGRVRVRFHWDRFAPGNADSSCPVRVSQSWAGAGHGAMYVPDIGDEVIVEFLEGDPDRPIITGRVYNAAAKPPLALPGAKHKVVVAHDDYGNEVILDSSPGDEHIRIHSPHHNSTLEIGKSTKFTTESDHGNITLGDSTAMTVGNSASMTVGASASCTLGNSTSVTVGSSQSVSIGPFSQSVSVGHNFAASFGYECTYIYGGGYGYANQKIMTEAKHDNGNIGWASIQYDAQTAIILTGGGSFTAPGAGNLGILHLNSSEARLSYGKDNRNVGPLSTTGPLVLANVLGLIGAAAGAAATVATTYMASAAHAKSSAGQARKQELSTAAAANPSGDEAKEIAEIDRLEQSHDKIVWGGAAGMLAGVAGSAVCGFLAAKVLRRVGMRDMPGKSKHQDAETKGVIVLDQHGISMGAGPSWKQSGPRVFVKTNPTMIELKATNTAVIMVNTRSGDISIKAPKIKIEGDLVLAGGKKIKQDSLEAM